MSAWNESEKLEKVEIDVSSGFRDALTVFRERHDFQYFSEPLEYLQGKFYPFQ